MVTGGGHDRRVIPIRAVVFDFDGVVRHWDDQDTLDVELRHGLEPGSIMGTAFGPELGEAVVTGRIGHEDWFAAIAEAVGSSEAVAEWSTHRGEVDPAAVELVDEVRAAGIEVGLLSNATTRLEEDLEVLGLRAHFDRIFNTARLGVCKPHTAVYQLVLQQLELPGEAVVFTDDHPGWAEAATAVGMHGLHFRGIPELRAQLRTLGVPVDEAAPDPSA